VVPSNFKGPQYNQQGEGPDREAGSDGRSGYRPTAAGARLIQAEGLDSKSVADLAASLAEALEDLHRLQRRLDRRIRRDQGRSEALSS
jgi:hypothetical protein